MLRTTRAIIFSTLLCFAMTSNAADRDHLAPTPPMGWMTWNMFQGDINETLIKQTADAMVSEGYAAAGYNYIFIDDLWQGGRDNRNNMIADPVKFPSGIKALADYVHSKGLKLGIYSDAAQLTCGGATASLNFEEQDAKTFASWGIDYLKYDYCGAPADSAIAHARYKKMGDALSKSGRDIAFGVCEWGQLHPEMWAHKAGGQLWRTSYDVRDMWKDVTKEGGMGILDIINITAPLYKYAGPGHWNDMDMLIVGLEGKGKPSSDLGGKGCNYTEYQSQMSMWCMMASPLAMSNDIRNASKEAKRILLNKDIIAINQDALGKAAKKVGNEGDCQIYMRELTGGRYALAIMNIGDKTNVNKTIALAKYGLTEKYNITDVWAKKLVAKNANKLKVAVTPHETKVVILEKSK